MVVENAGVDGHEYSPDGSPLTPVYTAASGIYPQPVPNPTICHRVLDPHLPLALEPAAPQYNVTVDEFASVPNATPDVGVVQTGTAPPPNVSILPVRHHLSPDGSPAVPVYTNASEIQAARLLKMMLCQIVVAPYGPVTDAPFFTAHCSETEELRATLPSDPDEVAGWA